MKIIFKKSRMKNYHVAFCAPLLYDFLFSYYNIIYVSFFKMEKRNILGC